MNFHFLKISKIFYTILILAIILIPGCIVVQHRQTIVQLLTPKRTSYTELYFENFTTLPTKIVTKTPLLRNPNHTTISYSFAFSIHNLENKNMVYTYEVDELGTEKTVLDKKSVSIKNGQSETITENYIMPKTYPRTEIVVNLAQKNLKIDFWMGEKLQ